MYNHNEIIKVHLELTSKCNAACPQCVRNIKGGITNPLIPITELTLNDIKTIFVPEFVSQLKNLYACGNFGDPIMAKDTLEILRYFRSINPDMFLAMFTNGGARPEAWWSELAEIIGKKGSVYFGIDGLEDTNHIYRRNVKWSILMRNVKAFIKTGGIAKWDYLVFRHNEHQVEEARKLSNSLGFREFNVKKTGRFIDYHEVNLIDKTEIKNRELKVIGYIERPLQEQYQNPALKNIDNLKKRYGNVENYLNSTQISCKVQKEKNIYISAEGYVLPCCWIAGQLYNTRRVTDSIFPLISKIGLEKFNAKLHPISDIIANGFFSNELPELWNKETITGGKPKLCSRICGQEFDQYTKQKENL